MTHRKERLPVAAGIVGPPGKFSHFSMYELTVTNIVSGSDFGVLQFVEDFLASSGIPDHVVTGTEVFETVKSRFSRSIFEVFTLTLIIVF